MFFRDFFCMGFWKLVIMPLLFKSFSNSILGVLIKREQKISFLILSKMYKTGRIAGYTTSPQFSDQR